MSKPQPQISQIAEIRERPLYRYAWNRMGRKDQLCTVLVRGAMNSCLVKFEDGFQAVTSRNSLRRAERS